MKTKVLAKLKPALIARKWFALALTSVLEHPNVVTSVRGLKKEEPP